MKSQEEKIQEVRGEIEHWRLEIEKIQTEIDNCKNEGKIKALKQQKYVMESRKNGLVNLLNILK